MVYFLKYIKWEIMFPAVVGVLTIRQTKCLVKKKIPVFLERNKTKNHNRSWKYQLFFLLLKHPQYTCQHTLFITQDTMSFALNN